MKQYIPQNTHKYGIKLFKLPVCCDKGYMWNVKVYAGKEQSGNASVPTKIVLKLSEKLLDAGRTIMRTTFTLVWSSPTAY